MDIQYLSRLKIKEMNDVELDAGVALALGLEICISEAVKGGLVTVYRDGKWELFSPTRNWIDFGYAISKLNVVLSTNNVGDGFSESDKYYSSHCGYSSTSFESRKDLRHVVAMSLTALALHNAKYYAKD